MTEDEFERTQSTTSLPLGDYEDAQEMAFSIIEHDEVLKAMKGKVIKR